MVSHLASLAEDTLVISFAPKTLAYSILKRIGELFPGPSKVGGRGGGGEGQRQGGWGTGSVAHFSRHSTRVGYTGGGQPKCDNQVSLCSPAPPTCLCRPLVRTCTRRTMWRRPWRAQVGGRVG